jgi:predicted nucleic acid-binding protein
VVSYLVDTSVLTRLIVVKDPLSQPARRAIDKLQQDRAGLLVAPQNLIEFWAVATRPVEANGLGLPVEKAAEEVTQFEEVFHLANEPPELFRRWRQLVETYAVKGKQVHDARLVAVMIEGGVDHILTFNVDDFRRYPDITAVSPHSFPMPSTPDPGRS